jgi:hypothetical protein
MAVLSASPTGRTHTSYTTITSHAGHRVSVAMQKSSRPAVIRPAERPSVLFDVATARLVEAKVLLPRAFSPGWGSGVAARLWSRLARHRDDRRQGLEVLLEVPDGARVFAP